MLGTLLASTLSIRKAGLFMAAVLFIGGGVLDQPAQARELNCAISVDYSRLSGSDYAFLGELERRVRDYVNDNSWTNDRFQARERIDCSIDIVFEEALSLTEFEGRLVVTSRRPIYGTMQATPVVQLSDSDWQFEYRRGQSLVEDINQFDSFTSLLDFYVYLILGYDYDTFSELGGTPHFERARRVAELAQSRGAIGWSQLGGSRSRGALIDQLLDSRYRPLRRAYYTYHLEGLDRFVSDTEAAREAMLEALETVEGVYEEVSRQYALDVFFTVKYREMAAVFDDSSLSGQAYDLLSQVDPAHLSEYNRLVE